MNSAEFKFKININPCMCCVGFLVTLGQKDWRSICQCNGVLVHPIRGYGDTENTAILLTCSPQGSRCQPNPLNQPALCCSNTCPGNLSPAQPCPTKTGVFLLPTTRNGVAYLQTSMYFHLQAEQNRSHVTYKLIKSHRGDDAGGFAEQFSALLSSSATSPHPFWHCPNGREPPLCQVTLCDHDSSLIAHTTCSCPLPAQPWRLLAHTSKCAKGLGKRNMHLILQKEGARHAYKSPQCTLHLLNYLLHFFWQTCLLWTLKYLQASAATAVGTSACCGESWDKSLGHCSHWERGLHPKALKCIENEKRLWKFKVTEELYWIVGIKHRENKKEKEKKKSQRQHKW